MTDPTNPFETEYAQNFIAELVSDKFSDSVFYTNEVAFDCLLFVTTKKAAMRRGRRRAFTTVCLTVHRIRICAEGMRRHLKIL